MSNQDDMRAATPFDSTAGTPFDSTPVQKVTGQSATGSLQGTEPVEIAPDDPLNKQIEETIDSLLNRVYSEGRSNGNRYSTIMDSKSALTTLIKAEVEKQTLATKAKAAAELSALDQQIMVLKARIAELEEK